jgi:type VI secretion system protein ImpC
MKLAEAAAEAAEVTDTAVDEPTASTADETTADAAEEAVAAPAAAADDISELDALLASLSDEPAPADGGAAAAEDALDPELEALLKSLG